MSPRDPMVHVRLPASLKERLQARAAESQRSLNAEIVHRLETSLDEAISPDMRGISRILMLMLKRTFTSEPDAEWASLVQEMREDPELRKKVFEWLKNAS